MNQIRAYFDNFVHLTDDEWEHFSSRLIRTEFPRKSMLLQAGKVENYLSFIEAGVVRYFIPLEDKDLTFGFTFAGAFTSAYDSFLTQMPSHYAVQALSHTVLWRISKKDLEDIYQLTTAGDRIGRKAAENLFLLKSRRELSLLNESAEQRYLNLYSEQPQLIREIPLKYIASYIGVTPQALSRIRKRIS